VDLLDITGFSRYEVTGPNVKAWLNKLVASKIPGSNRAGLAPMLSPQGRLKGDLTILNWGDDTYWLMGSYYLRAWHLRWFNDHLEDGVNVRDLGEEVCGFGLAGPRSKAVIEKVAEQDVGDLPFMGCRDVDIGPLRAKVARMSVTGELGYEINVRYGDHIALRRLLLEAGESEGLRECGFNAMLSTRIEKSFGIWSAEFTQLYTAAQTGMDRWIDWDKENFIGREAALPEKEGNGPALVLVTLQIEDGDSDASGYEPVWHGDDRVGFVTSGAYGYTVCASLAMAMVDRVHASEGTELGVHVVGKLRTAKVIPSSPYDPKGLAMRG